MTLFDARLLAPMWLSVAVASGKDGARPALDRTVSIEAFHEGIRLTATDSYSLLTAWVPNIDSEFDTRPELDAAPYAVAVAADEHGRARGLLGHCLGLVAAAAKANDPEPIEVRVSLGVVDEVEDPGMFEGMQVPYVVIELPDRERVKLRTYEGEFPNWRSLLTGHHPTATVGVALTCDRLAQMAKLAKYHEDRPIRFLLGGDLAAVRVEVKDTTIEGVVMPYRWDFETGAPHVEPEAAADADGGES